MPFKRHLYLKIRFTESRSQRISHQLIHSTNGRNSLCQEPRSKPGAKGLSQVLHIGGHILLLPLAFSREPGTEVEQLEFQPVPSMAGSGFPCNTITLTPKGIFL